MLPRAGRPASKVSLQGAEVKRQLLLVLVEHAQLSLLRLVDHGQHAGDRLADDLAANAERKVAGEKRRRVATSRWQARALDEFDSAVRVARRDGVT